MDEQNFYAGGTAVKDISANDLIKDIKAKRQKGVFVEDRNDFLNEVKVFIIKQFCASFDGSERS